jgi:hypothetical protein
MPIREIYVKLPVNFAGDPKVRALTRFGIDGVLSRDLFVQMILYCKDMLTDGFVPAEQVGLLVYPVPPDHAEQLAKQLASVGLTKEVSKDGAQGWEVLAYVRRNGTRADVEALSAERAEYGRKGGLKSRKTPDQDASRSKRQAKSKQVAKQKISKSKPETESETESDQNHLEADVSRKPAGSTTQGPDEDDDLIPVAIDAVCEREGRVLTDAEARRLIAIVRDRAEKAPVRIRNGEAHLRAAIGKEPDLFAELIEPPPSLSEILAAPDPDPGQHADLHGFCPDEHGILCAVPGCGLPERNRSRHYPEARSA